MQILDYLFLCVLYVLYILRLLPYLTVQHTLYSCPVLMKREFSRHIFRKIPDIKFNENPSSGSRVTCGQAWRGQ